MAGGYEKSLDKVLFAAGEVALPSGRAALAVELVSYAGGEPKVALVERSSRGEWGWKGRIPGAVAVEVGKLVVKCGEWLAAHSGPALKAA